MNIHQSLKHAPLAAAIVTALGLSAVAPICSAATLANGDYTIFVNKTPYNYALSRYDFGTAGAWNSSFTFGGSPPGNGSQAMWDNGNNRNPATGGVSPYGSGVLGDGWAGRVGIHVNNGIITVTSFSKDIIWNTAGGDFTQYYLGQSPGNLGGATITGSGTVNANGDITLTLGDATNATNIGRHGAIFNPVIIGARWNFDDSCQMNGAGWNGSTFTTGSVSTNTSSTNCAVKNTISGTALSCSGDANGDGITDCAAILVSGGAVGSDWGSFLGSPYFEVWNVQIRSAIIKSATATTAFNTPINVSIPPVTSTGIAPLTIKGETKSCSNGGSVTFTPGSVTMNSSGAVTSSTGSAAYTPASTFAGVDTCTYTITDGNGEAKTGTVTITVQSAGSPSANDDSSATNQNTAVTINVLSNDVATAGTSLNPASVSITSPPSNGGTSVNTSTGAVTYTPNSGFVGTDTFMYTVNNNVTPTPATSNQATVTVQVNETALTSSGTYGPGALALLKHPTLTDGRLSAADVPADSALASGSQCIGGCYDFKVTGVTVGSQIQTVLPKLSNTISIQNVTVDSSGNGLRYRKYMNNAWKTFDTSSGDEVASAPLTAGGGCPLPSAGGWHTWPSATAGSNVVGDQCIRLTITDNGPNDSDSSNGNIADPSGAGAGTGGVTTTTTPPGLDSFGSSTQGCSISPITRKSTEGGEWWLVGGFLVWLRALLWRRKKASTIK